MISQVNLFTMHFIFPTTPCERLFLRPSEILLPLLYHVLFADFCSSNPHSVSMTCELYPLMFLLCSRSFATILCLLSNLCSVYCQEVDPLFNLSLLVYFTVLCRSWKVWFLFFSLLASFFDCP
jgi:hypothetical protein